MRPRPKRLRDTWHYPTDLNDRPEDILRSLTLEVKPGWVAAYEASRGWQIAAVDKDGNIFVDCDQRTGQIHILR